MEEIWKDVPGYDGEYKISNFGNVRSFKKGIGERDIRPMEGRGRVRYLYVCLRKDGTRKNFYVHRLVAEAFCNRKNGADFVNHIDYNPKNNFFWNLEWATQKENAQYSAHRMRKPKSVCRRTNTGEKYISIQTAKNRTFYRVTIKRISAFKECKTFQEAIEYRDKALENERNMKRRNEVEP